MRYRRRSTLHNWRGKMMRKTRLPTGKMSKLPALARSLAVSRTCSQTTHIQYPSQHKQQRACSQKMIVVFRTCATLRSNSGNLHFTYIAGRSFGFKPYASRICRATRTLSKIVRRACKLGRFQVRFEKRTCPSCAALPSPPRHRRAGRRRRGTCSTGTSYWGKEVQGRRMQARTMRS